MLSSAELFRTGGAKVFDAVLASNREHDSSHSEEEDAMSLADFVDGVLQ